MTSFTLILNPQAGKGRAKELRSILQRRLQELQASAEIIPTTKRGDATLLARNASTPVVVAVGGDGTINEVANGVIGSSKILGIIPCGSGNDFIKSVGIPPDPIRALQALVEGVEHNIRHADVGSVRCVGKKTNGFDDGNSEERYFVNGVGIGFDAAVAERTLRTRFLSGQLLYLWAVLRTLGNYKSPNFTIQLDSMRFDSRNLLIAVGNGACAGGGFYLTPDAKVDDGLLDVCDIKEMSVPKILQLMPRVMKGRHHNFDGVTMHRTKSLSVCAPEAFFVHADGEMVGKGVHEVHIGVLEKALPVIAS